MAGVECANCRCRVASHHGRPRFSLCELESPANPAGGLLLRIGAEAEAGAMGTACSGDVPADCRRAGRELSIVPGCALRSRCPSSVSPQGGASARRGQKWTRRVCNNHTAVQLYCKAVDGLREKLQRNKPRSQPKTHGIHARTHTITTRTDKYNQYSCTYDDVKWRPGRHAHTRTNETRTHARSPRYILHAPPTRLDYFLPISPVTNSW